MDKGSKNLLLGIDAFDDAKYVVAFNLLLPLAEKGEAKAQCYIATMYQCGLGVKVNGVQAVKWFEVVVTKKIVEENLSAVACNNLSAIYITGLPGIDVDKSLAKFYSDEAKKLGFQM
ncbi:MAG: sel1 repeat family protein [Ectothiorhodospiraceae bacterium]|nr:sel1 repeat family protein [Ectothiorhodospiraceae bacterium]